jgi:uncharacterized membrane protein
MKKEDIEKVNLPEVKENWHALHKKNSSIGEVISDKTTSYMGSWNFIILQTIIVIIWIILNVIGFVNHWDPYPFIVLNLIFSTQAAYAAPIIMMSQNRQGDRDRQQAISDYKTNIQAKKDIEKLEEKLEKLENEKINRILEILENK